MLTRNHSKGSLTLPNSHKAGVVLTSTGGRQAGSWPCLTHDDRLICHVGSVIGVSIDSVVRVRRAVPGVEVVDPAGGEVPTAALPPGGDGLTRIAAARSANQLPPSESACDPLSIIVPTNWPGCRAASSSVVTP